jgi:hemoglobin
VTVVDDVLDRILDAPRRNALLRWCEAHHAVARAGFQDRVAEPVCEATGGPQRDTGRPMRDAHARLAITAEEWAAVLDDRRQTLAKFRVPDAELGELFAVVESTTTDIVMPRCGP